MRLLIIGLLITKVLSAGSLFERTLARKDVSYLVIEDRKSGPWVTLLLVPAGMDAFKGQNYPVHIRCSNFKEAAEVMYKLDYALLNDKQVHIKLLGSMVTKWQIQAEPQG